MGKEKVDKRDSPEGANSVASELQRLSLVKKAGEKMLQQLSMTKPIEPLTVDSIDSEQTLGCFLPNQPVRNQWNFQQEMERHFSVETKFPFESSDHLHFVRNLDYC